MNMRKKVHKTTRKSIGTPGLSESTGDGDGAAFSG